MIFSFHMVLHMEDELDTSITMGFLMKRKNHLGYEWLFFIIAISKAKYQESVECVNKQVEGCSQIFVYDLLNIVKR